MSVLLGNSGAPRWYADAGRGFDDYLNHIVESGATSAEIVLHHGPYDERTARVHVVESDWSFTVAQYQRHRIAVQLHVSLDRRFASSRWRDDRDGLKKEFEPVLALASTIVENQERVALVLHGAAESISSIQINEDSTTGLLDWLAAVFETRSLPVRAAVELGAAKDTRQTASARSRESVLRIVRNVASERVGICWDLAHDCENAAVEPGWTPVPDAEFLRRVVHVHLHDLGEDGLAHYPLLLGTVPFAEQLAALARIGPLPSLTMEVRWLCASRMGEPWAILARSYAAVHESLAELYGAGSGPMDQRRMRHG